jgi:hypothetical protein
VAQNFVAKLTPGVVVQLPNTPWTGTVDAAGYSLNNLADLNMTGQIKQNGVVLAITPWTVDIDGGGHKLSNVSNIYVTGLFYQNGVPVITSITPWPSDVDAASHNLNNAGAVNAASVSTTGNVTATGDVSAANVTATGKVNTGSVYATGSYYLNGVVLSFTPWTSDVDAANHNLNNAGAINAATVNTTGNITATGDVNAANITASAKVNAADVYITGHVYRNGVILAIQNQAVVTASRASNVTYQNTSGKAMFVMTCWNLGGQNSTIDALSDTVTPPVQQVAQIFDSSTSATTVELFFMVLNGYFYQCKVTAGTPTLVSWTEYY